MSQSNTKQSIIKMADEGDNKNELIGQFAGVTGVDEDRAKFYLEAASWNLELAMASFYDEGEAEGPVEQISDDDDVVVTHPTESEPSPLTRKPVITSRFATIGSMKDAEQAAKGSDSEDERQAFYAGGSERSGQQILGPSKKKNSKKMVESLFKSAKEHGAETVEESDRRTTTKKPKFRGAGYRLGETEDASEMVAGATSREEPRKVEMVLKLWKTGFSVDNGPLRNYENQENKEFLDAVSKSEIPRELVQMAKGGEVSLDMEDHRTEDYVPPKVQVQAFTGAGHTLGSPVPNVVFSAGAGASSALSGGSAAQPSVDNSKPITNLQIRLINGSRLVAKFNHSHLISDIRNYIISSRPEYASSTFVLMTTFPNKELTDESLTLEDAKLLNAVIVQKLK